MGVIVCVCVCVCVHGWVGVGVYMCIGVWQTQRWALSVLGTVFQLFSITESEILYRIQNASAVEKIMKYRYRKSVFLSLLKGLSKHFEGILHAITARFLPQVPISEQTTDLLLFYTVHIIYLIPFCAQHQRRGCNIQVLLIMMFLH